MRVGWQTAEYSCTRAANRVGDGGIGGLGAIRAGSGWT